MEALTRTGKGISSLGFPYRPPPQCGSFTTADAGGTHSLRGDPLPAVRMAQRAARGVLSKLGVETATLPGGSRH